MNLRVFGRVVERENLSFRFYDIRPRKFIKYQFPGARLIHVPIDSEVTQEAISNFRIAKDDFLLILYHNVELQFAHEVLGQSGRVSRQVPADPVHHQHLQGAR